MKVSLDGLLLRMMGDKGQKFSVREFLRHYREVNAAMKAGDLETVKKFFETEGEK